MTERIELRAEANRSGIKILKAHFDLLSDFIIQTLDKSREITLNQLIALPPIDLPGFTGDYTWCLLQVKRHLELTGLIKTEILRLRIQVIKKVKKYPRRYVMYS